jgi:hypothetical protein
VKFHTVKSIAADQGLHTETVYRALATAELAGTRHKFGWRITDAEYQAWLKRGQRPADELASLAKAVARG